jgi:hypothetical protein
VRIGCVGSAGGFATGVDGIGRCSGAAFSGLPRMPADFLGLSLRLSPTLWLGLSFT